MNQIAAAMRRNSVAGTAPELNQTNARPATAPIADPMGLAVTPAMLGDCAAKYILESRKWDADIPMHKWIGARSRLRVRFAPLRRPSRPSRIMHQGNAREATARPADVYTSVSTEPQPRREIAMP